MFFGNVQVTHSLNKLDRLHLGICVKRLYKHVMSEDQDRLSLIEALQESTEFHTLIAATCRRAPHFDAVMVQETIVHLHVFGYGSESLPMQIFLQLAKFHLSDLTLDQILALGECLCAMAQSKQTLTLQEGIRVLLPYLQDQLDILSPLDKISLIYHFGNVMLEDFMNQTIISLRRESDEWNLKHAIRSLEAFTVLDANKRPSTWYYRDLVNLSIGVVHAGRNRIYVEQAADLCAHLLVLKSGEEQGWLVDDVLLSCADQIAGNADMCAGEKLRVMKLLWSESLYHGNLLQDLLETCFLDVQLLSPGEFSTLLQ